MKKFSKASDDPVNVQIAMQMQTSIYENDQYGTNIKDASTWMESTDTALTQINTVIGNVRNNLVKAGDAPYTQDERDKINDEVKQQVTQIAQILNTNLKGEYIFGGTQGLSKPVTTTTDASKNVSIEYVDDNGNAVEKIPDVVSNGFNISNWKGKNVTFSVNGKDYTVTVDNSKDTNTIDDVVKDLNSKVQSNNVKPAPANPATSTDPGVKDKINVVKTNDGNIKFLAVNSSDDITIKSTDVGDLSIPTAGQKLSNMAMENIGADKNIEVSQGVVLTYNATASSVMQYGDSTDSTTGDNLSALMNRIQHHLAGQVLSPVSSGTTGSIEVKNSDGTSSYYVWKDDEAAATEELDGQDLKDIDLASKQVLKVTSDIGAKENRMTDLSTQNSSLKLSMTDSLSKTEDVDISQTTIEYYTAITTYQACLQTSAKVIQPTLLDYIK